MKEESERCGFHSAVALLRPIRGAGFNLGNQMVINESVCPGPKLGRKANREEKKQQSTSPPPHPTPPPWEGWGGGERAKVTGFQN